MGTLLLAVLALVALTALAGAWRLSWRHERARAVYGAELEKALEDGVLTPEERLQLARLKEERDLSDADVRFAALALYRRALTEATADARVTEEEEGALARLQAQLGLTDADLEPERGHLERLNLLARLERGVLPVIVSPVALPPGELAHWVVHATLCEWIAVPGSPRRDPPHLSFRVDAAEPFYADGPRAPLGPSPHVLPIDLGILVITGRVTLFRGAKRRYDVPHSRLTGVALYRDGLRITVSGPAAAYSFLTADPELTVAVLLRAAREARAGGLPTPTPSPRP